MKNGGTAGCQRIVSLLPSATEIVYALGLGDRLVGVTHECDFPHEAKSKPVLTASALPPASNSGEIDRHVRRHLHQGSSIYTLDAELLEALAPDLILTQELCAVCAVSYEIVARAARRLRGDSRIVSLEPSSLDDVYENIETVGTLTGTTQKAATVVGKLRARAETLVWEAPAPQMGGALWPRGLVDLAGEKPILANPGANSHVLDWGAI